MRDVIGRYQFREKQRSEMARHGILPKSFGTGHAAESGQKLTVDELVRLAELGILDSDIRVELIDGVLFEMAPTGRPHGNRVSNVAKVFWERVPNNVQVYLGSTVRLTDETGPQPDVALLRPEASFESDHVPRADELLLVVEVAGSSLRTDRGEKARRYAQSGIPELWIFILDTDEIKVSRQPTPEGYADVRLYRQGDTLSIQELPDIRLAVDELLA